MVGKWQSLKDHRPREESWGARGVRRKVVGEQGLEVAVWRWAVLGNSGVQGLSWEEWSSGDGDTAVGPFLSVCFLFSMTFIISYIF